MSGVRFTIAQRSTNQRIFRLGETLEKRVEAIVNLYSRRLADRLLPWLQDSAPRDIAGYPGMLRVQQFKLGGVIGAVGILAPGSAYLQRLSHEDEPRTVLYIRPKVQGGVAVDPASVVLWKSNPWTMGTLPFEPKKSAAAIVARRVSQREAKKIDDRRRAERPQIDAQLRDMGVVPMRMDPITLDRRVIRDMAFEVLRREFGMGGAPHVAHWRPAIRFAKTILAKSVLKSFLRWLVVPSEGRWKRRPPVKAGKVSEARKVQRFQAYIRT